MGRKIKDSINVGPELRETLQRSLEQSGQILRFAVEKGQQVQGVGRKSPTPPGGKSDRSASYDQLQKYKRYLFAITRKNLPRVANHIINTALNHWARYYAGKNVRAQDRAEVRALYYTSKDFVIDKTRHALQVSEGEISLDFVPQGVYALTMGLDAILKDNISVVFYVQ